MIPFLFAGSVSEFPKQLPLSDWKGTPGSHQALLQPLHFDYHPAPHHWQQAWRSLIAQRHWDSVPPSSISFEPLQHCHSLNTASTTRVYRMVCACCKNQYPILDKWMKRSQSKTQQICTRVPKWETREVNIQCWEANPSEEHNHSSTHKTQSCKNFLEQHERLDKRILLDSRQKTKAFGDKMSGRTLE